MKHPVVDLQYSGDLSVRPYRRGTYLGERHLEEAIEQALGARYSFGEGWHGRAEIVIRLYEAYERENAA